MIEHDDLAPLPEDGQRLVSGRPASPNEENVERALRPARLAD
jgi:hypothetical protein